LPTCLQLSSDAQFQAGKAWKTAIENYLGTLKQLMP